jgi:hypothetical protein
MPENISPKAAPAKDRPPDLAPDAVVIIDALKAVGIQATIASVSPGIHDTVFVVVVAKGA